MNGNTLTTPTGEWSITYFKTENNEVEIACEMPPVEIPYFANFLGTWGLKVLCYRLKPFFSRKAVKFKNTWYLVMDANVHPCNTELLEYLQDAFQTFHQINVSHD